MAGRQDDTLGGGLPAFGAPIDNQDHPRRRPAIVFFGQRRVALDEDSPLSRFVPRHGRRLGTVRCEEAS